MNATHLTSAVAVVLSSAALLNQQLPEDAKLDTLTAGKIRIVDATGNVGIEMGYLGPDEDKSFALVFFGNSGKGRMVLSQKAGSDPYIRVDGESGKGTVEISDGSVRFVDENDVLRLKLGIAADNFSQGLWLMGSDGRALSDFLQVGPVGLEHAQLRLYRPSGRVGAFMHSSFLSFNVPADEPPRSQDDKGIPVGELFYHQVELGVGTPSDVMFERGMGGKKEDNDDLGGGFLVLRDVVGSERTIRLMSSLGSLRLTDDAGRTRAVLGASTLTRGCP